MLWSTKLVDLTVSDAAILLLIYFLFALIVPSAIALIVFLWNMWKIARKWEQSK